MVVWVTVEVIAAGEVEGVMVIITVTRIVEGVGAEMMLVEVVLGLMVGLMMVMRSMVPLGVMRMMWMIGVVVWGF